MLSVVLSNFCFILLPLIMQFAKQSHQSLQLSPSLSDLLNMQAFARIAKVDAGGFVLKTPLLLPLSFNFSFYTLFLQSSQ